MRWSAAAAILAAGLATLPAAAVTPYQVKDIGSTSTPVSSSPGDFISLGSYAVFFTADGSLWRSDDTVAGTYRLDVCAACNGPISAFGILGDAFFFLVGDDHGEQALWVTRGTAATTDRLQKPFTPLVSGSLLSASFGGQGLVYFFAAPVEGEAQLWRSDGTRAGTFEVADYSPAAATLPEGLTFYKGEVYFGADDGAGPGLWKTDGTPRGTLLIRRFTPPAEFEDPGPCPVGVAGGSLVFAMATPERGYELWATNGTAKGTLPLPDLVPGPDFPIFYSFMQLGSQILFVADNGRGQNLWVTNGTAKGTRQLTEFSSSSAFGPYFGFFGLILGNTTFFPADDGVHGVELWASDGTAAGTRMVSDVCPGSCSSFAYPEAILGDRLLFAAADGRHGDELWSTDGSAAGTRLVADICHGSCDASPIVVAVLGERALLWATDPTNGMQLWRTDGTAAHTLRLTAFPSSGSPFPPPSTVAAGVMLFQGSDPEHGDELWRSDATLAGTRFLDDLDPSVTVTGSSPRNLSAAGSQLYLVANDTIHGNQLWTSDGTAGGTVQVSDLPSAVAEGFSVGASAAVGTTLYFVASTEQGGELWRSDPTPGSAFSLTPAGVSAGGEVVTLGSTVFFTGYSQQTFSTLWSTDGTVAGTVPVDPSTHDTEQAMGLVAWNGGLYYFLSGATGYQLWRTDGTQAGTTQIANLSSGDSQFEMLTAYAGRLYFFAQDSLESPVVRLWSTDGTTAGTRMETSLGQQTGPPPTLPLEPAAIAVAGNQLFLFTSLGLWAGDGTDAGTHLVSSSLSIARDLSLRPLLAPFGSRLAFINAGEPSGSNGLWLSDGTAAGTMALTDSQGNAITPEARLAVFAGSLFFPLATPDGIALWQSDGTPAGTASVLTLGPGAQGYGLDLTVAGQRLYLSASDPAAGDQLWALRP